MIKQLLNKSIEEKSIIGIRTKNLEWGEVIIGFVVNIEEKYLTINEIDEFGCEIGSTIIELDNILHVEYKDKYQKQLQFTFHNKHYFNIDKRVTIWKNGVELIPYFKEIEEKKILCTLFLNEEDFIYGFLLNYSKTNLLISNIGDDGYEDGMSCYYIDDIIGLRYNSLTEQKIMLLKSKNTSTEVG